MGYRPRGGGADGEGGGTAPSPVPTCHRERFSIRAVDHPRLPALPAPPPAPSRGGGQCMAIAPDTLHGGKQDLRGVSRLKPGEGMLSRGSASMGYRPRGGGADGEGGGGDVSPLPCRSRFPLNGIYRSPPPPGRASVWRLTRWPCPGLRLSECHLRPRRDCQIPDRIYGESPRGGRKRSPRPYLIVSPKTPFQSGSQPPGLPPPRGHNQK